MTNFLKSYLLLIILSALVSINLSSCSKDKGKPESTSETTEEEKSDDKETIDGFHGGEVTYLKILIDMLNQDSKLKNVTNTHKLNQDLTKAKNRFIIYDY